LYDHEFQESRIDVVTGDLRLDYNFGTWPSTITSLSVHIYLVYGLDLKTNEYAASIVTPASNAGGGVSVQ
jgi:hypothetical protein